MSSNTIFQYPIFSPTQGSGCSLWLDGADPNGTGRAPVAGSVVPTWIDKSGNGKHATVSGTPTYLSGGGISFNGTNSYYSNLSFAYDLSKRSVFFVMKVNTFLMNAGVMPFIPNPNSGTDHVTTSGLSIETIVSGMRFYGNSGGYTGDIPNASLTTVNLYNDNMNGTAGTQYLNGSLTGSPTASYTGTTTSGYLLGARWLSGAVSLSYVLTGNIYEIILYNGPISTSLRQQTEGYLAWKWGIQTSLPSNHPYRNLPIYGISTLPRSLQNQIPAGFSQSSSPFTFFNPNTLGNCALWLDAADPSTVSLSGTTVTQWRDKSGNGNNTTTSSGTPTYTRNAVNNLNSITLPGSSSYFLGGFSSTFTGSNMNIFGVSSMDASSGAAGRIIGLGVPSTNEFNNILYTTIYRNSGQGLYFYRNSAVATVSIPAYNSSFLFRAGHPGSGTEFFAINGDLTNTTASTGTGSFNISAYSVGINLNTADNPTGLYVGTMSELLVYFGTTLTTLQIQQVEGYLAWKWGLQGNLPSNHPYKNAPPGLSVPSISPTLRLNLGGYSPFNISGIALWLDAADTATITSSGGYVTQWNDKSGNGRHASNVGTGVVSGSRLNQLNTINFASGSYLLTPSFSMDTITRTAFAVYNFTSNVYPTDSSYYDVYFLFGNTATTNAFQFKIVRMNTSPYQWIGEFGITNVGSFPNTFPTGFYSGASGPNNQAFMLGVQRSAVQTGVITYTGSNITPLTFNGTNAFQATEALRVGASMSNTQIAEILYFNSALPLNQFQTVEGYLAWKWGLQGNLPSNHPFKRWPPPPS